jgi:hypothetical protein
MACKMKVDYKKLIDKINFLTPLDKLWSSIYKDLSRFLIASSGILSVACLGSISQTKCYDLLNVYMFGLNRIGTVFFISFICAYLLAVKDRMRETSLVKIDMAIKNNEVYSPNLNIVFILLPQLARGFGLIAAGLFLLTIFEGREMMAHAVKKCADSPVESCIQNKE